MKRSLFILLRITTGILGLIMAFSISGFSQPRTVPLPYSSDSKNYIRSWDATAPETNPNTLMTRSLRDVKQVTRYFDGVGRPLQTVVKQGSLITNGTPVDMVSAVEYDAFGRETFKYLPTPSTATDATKNDGNFKLNPFVQQAAFYSSTDPAKNPIANQSETFFYGQTKFEASPLNRVQESFALGNSWVGTAANATESNRKSVKAKYYINTPTDAVRIWTVTNGAIGTFGTYASPTTPTNAVYPAGALHKIITIDEHGKQVIDLRIKKEK